MKKESIAQIVTGATEELEGKIKQIDKDTDWVYHATLYQALDALERASEFLNEGARP